MTDTQADAALIGGIGLLERAINYTLGSLHMVTSDALPHPTPCSEWDLRALLGHLDDSFVALCEAADLGRVELDRPAGREWTIDPVGTVRGRACQLVGAWANAAEGPDTVTIAGSPLTTSIVSSTGALEVAVHGWDVARACGQDHPIPPSLAEEMFALSAFLVSGADRPTRFAAPIEVGLLASPGDRLVAFLGRDPSS